MKSLMAIFLLFACAVTALGAGKDYVPGFKLVSAGNLAGDVTSTAIDVRGWDNVLFQVIATGTPTGDVIIECTLMPQKPPALNAQVWSPLTITPAPEFTGSAGTLLVPVNQTGCMFLRFVYDRDSGSGSADVWVGQKQI